VESEKCRLQNAYPMKHHNLQDRTRKFALSVIKFTESLPRDDTSSTLGRQLLRSGTSVGANYRAHETLKILNTVSRCKKLP
jgi:four helix bundle protein